MKYLRTYAARLLILIVLVSSTAGCGVKLMSWDEEIQIGNEAAPQFIEEGGGELPNSQVVTYTRQIGERLVLEIDQSEIPEELEWEFHVLDSAVINAFALPGGKVFMSRGLMAKMNNEAQLAGVLGHEIAHVTQRHGNQRISQAMLVQFGVVGLGVAGSMSDNEWAQLIGLAGAGAGQLYLLSYTRSQESEADRYGVAYMAGAGYNPVGQIQVMEILREAGGGGGTPEWLSTHPAPDTRIRDLEQLIREKYPQYDEPGVYVFREQAFEQNILVPLSKMPPPKHPQQQNAMLGPAEFEAMTGIAWEQIEHMGCECHKK